MSLAREKFHRHREKAVLNVHALEIAEKKLGVTLETLADKTGLTKSYLSKVERGLNTPSIAVALKLAKALNVQVEELFSEESDGVDGYSIVRRDQRKSLSSGDDGPAYASLAQQIGARALLPFIVHPRAISVTRRSRSTSAKSSSSSMRARSRSTS